jgi:hypothetical protein
MLFYHPQRWQAWIGMVLWIAVARRRHRLLGKLLAFLN